MEKTDKIIIAKNKNKNKNKNMLGKNVPTFDPLIAFPVIENNELISNPEPSY